MKLAECGGSKPKKIMKMFIKQFFFNIDCLVIDITGLILENCVLNGTHNLGKKRLFVRRSPLPSYSEGNIVFVKNARMF